MRTAHARQLGRFRVAGRFYDRLRADEGTNLFDRMVVLDVKHDYAKDEREYLAVHPAFRAVQPGEMVPEYIAWFREGSAIPEWQEIQHDKGESIHEYFANLDRELAARRGPAVVRDWQPSACAGSRLERERNGCLGLEVDRRRIVDIQRGGWRGRLGRLLQRWRTGVLDLLGWHGYGTASDCMPEGRLDVLATGVRPVHVRGEQHAHGDGMPGQGARGDADAADALGADVAPWPPAPFERATQAAHEARRHKREAEDGSGENPSFG